jgi:cytochrome c oxidase assembly protein subunit 15
MFARTVSLAPHDASARDRLAPVRLWLWTVAVMIALTAAVGAATRLTGSGLSITEWNPILGVVPPLTEADWLAALAKYREIPQYKLINKGMSLEAFKVIYWWEWGHRMLARSIGLAFALPFLVLLAMRRLPSALIPSLLGLFALGALQGAVGWYMVRSGLVDRVDVSQYRLAMHLGLAVLIFGLLVWTALRLVPRTDGLHLATVTRRDVRIAGALTGLVFLQILLGALVAGLKAGRSYNTWPLMDGSLVPGGLLHLQPLWLNLFENAATVQFNHRVLAYLLAGLAVAHAIRLSLAADDPRLRTSAWLLASAILAQAALGIWTLLAWVPLSLGVAHQIGAFATFGLAIRHMVLLRHATPAGRPDPRAGSWPIGHTGGANRNR